MEWSLWLGYVGVVTLVVLSPGPSVLLASSQRMRYGASAARATIGGDLTANILQMTAASFGLAAVVQASAALFAALKWVGVAYLVSLGLSRLLRTNTTERADATDREAQRERLTKSFRRGFVVSAANPKAVVFFAGLFPLFLSSEVPLLPQLLLLGTTFVLLDGAALSAYSYFGIRLKRWLRDRGREHWENRITGGLLTGAGLALAAKR